jgi:AraC family transcriptional regulator
MDDQDAQHFLGHDPSSSALTSRGLSHGQVRAVHDFIDDSLPTSISLNDLAALTGLSLSHFTKQFKRATGLPPYQYVIQQRVERAKVLLRDDTLNVAEVSQALGFFDQSHFVRHFKARVGVTPSDYREGKN